MRVWTISDTHGFHEELKVPENIDLVIHCGDSTNSRYDKNDNEFIKFYSWFNNLKIPNKILIAGNHDKWATTSKYVELLEKSNIKYLHDELYELNGIKIWGSPYTPSTPSPWFFTIDRSKLKSIWDMIPECDILITHGPPKYILDIAQDYDSNGIVNVGCNNLNTQILNRIKPKYHLFGHVHDNDVAINSGVRIYQDITFINSSCVTDGKFYKGVTNNGVVFDYK